MAYSKGIFYAAVGVGDLALEKAKKAQDILDPAKLKSFDIVGLRGQLESTGAKAIVGGTKFYGNLVERGRKTIGGIKNSTATKRAVAQTKTARSQTKAAVTSAKKAATSTFEASKKAASSL